MAPSSTSYLKKISYPTVAVTGSPNRFVRVAVFTRERLRGLELTFLFETVRIPANAKMEFRATGAVGVGNFFSRPREGRRVGPVFHEPHLDLVAVAASDQKRRGLGAGDHGLELRRVEKVNRSREIETRLPIDRLRGKVLTLP
jgi:hypothetical protein